MTSDVEMLPLPEDYDQNPAGNAEIQDYAHANVEHHTAAKDAEIEALRAEVAAWSKSYDRAVDLGQQHRDRAERMAEALRDADCRSGYRRPARQRQTLPRRAGTGEWRCVRT